LGWVWPVLVVLGLAVLAGLAYGLLRGERGRSRPTRATAREILDERFARGEIEPEDYRQRIETLR
jgi:putative membrane protein